TGSSATASSTRARISLRTCRGRGRSRSGTTRRGCRRSDPPAGAEAVMGWALGFLVLGIVIIAPLWALIVVAQHSRELRRLRERADDLGRRAAPGPPLAPVRPPEEIPIPTVLPEPIPIAAPGLSTAPDRLGSVRPEVEQV